MKKKRLLSLLLATILASSSFSLTASSAPSAAAEPTTSATIVEADGWLANGATLATTDETDANGDGKYIHVSNPAILPGIVYKDNNVVLKAGKTYKLALSMRSPLVLNPSASKDYNKYVNIRLILNSTWDNLIADTTLDKIVKTLEVTPESLSNGSLTLKDTWTDYSIVFKVGSSDITFGKTGLGLAFRGDGATDDWTSFDIDAISIHEVEKGAESGKYLLVDDINLADDYLDADNWGTHASIGNAGSKVAVVETEEYYTAAADAAGSVSIIPADTTAQLTPGVYTLTGDFRVAGGVHFDELKAASSTTPYSAIEKNLSASFAGLNKNVVIGYFDWTPVSFTFDLPAGGSLADLEIALDAVRALDYKNLELTFTFYDYNEEWEGSNGDGARFIDGGADSYYKLASTEKNASETMYNVSFIPDEAHKFEIASYTLSFSIRNDAANASASNYLELKLGTGYSDGYLSKTGSRTRNEAEVINVKSITKNGISYTGDSYKHDITSDWIKYVIEFDLKTLNVANIFLPNTAGLIFMIGGDEKPVNIADLSIAKNGVDVDISNYKLSNLGSSYHQHGFYGGTLETVFARYYTTADTDIAALVYAGSDETIHNSGSYAIKGSFRSAADTTITADVKGTTASVDLTAGQWTDVELKLEMREIFKMSDIIIYLGGADVDFTAIDFAGNEIPVSDNWESPEGKQVVFVEETEDYLILAADPDNMPVDVTNANGSPISGSHRYDVVSLPAGTYTVSFKARVDASAEKSGGIMLGLGGFNNVESRYSLFNPSGCVTAAIEYAKVDGADASFQYKTLTDEWMTFETKFTSTDSYKIKVIAAEREAAINIKDFSVIDNATGTEVGGYRFDTSADNVYGGKPGISYKAVSHYTTAGTDAHQLVYIGTDRIFAPGLYTFTTTAKSTVNNDILALSVTNGTIIASAPVSKQWQKVSIEVDARESFNMSDVVLDFSGDLYFSEFEIDGYEYIFNEDWEGDNNSLTPFVDIGGGYTTISALNPDNPVESGYIANLKVVDLPAGTYKFSADVRNSPSSSTNLKNGFFAGINGWYSGNALFYPTNANSKTDVAVISSKLDGIAIDHQFPILTNDWQKYESEFIIDSAKTLYIAVYRYAGFDYNTADLKNLSIINTATGAEVAENGAYTFTSTTGNFANGGATQNATSYYTTEGSGAVAIKPTASKECAPGVYTVTGNFNALVAGKLTAVIKGKTYAEFEIDSSWKTLEIVFDVRDSFNLEDIRLAFDCDYINFSEVKITEEIYTTLGNWEGENGEIIVKVDIPEAYYILSSGSAGATNGYSFKTPTLPAGAFKLTFDMRLDPKAATATTTYLNLRYGGRVESCGSLHTVQDRYLWNDPANKYLFTVTSSKINDVDVTDTSTRTPVTKDWSTYEIEFNSDSNYPIWFIYDTACENVNIKNFSVTNALEFTEVVADDVTEFAPASNGYGTTGGTVRMGQSYYTTAGSGITSISPAANTASDYELIPGTYYIKGNFRANGESATLSAAAGAATLEEIGGETIVNLNGETWREVTFVLKTTVKLRTTDIKLMFNNGDIDFTDDITIELIEKYIDISEVNMGTVITLLLLKKEETEAYDPTNMLSGAISRSKKNWEYGDQTLNFVKAVDGNYLAARNITKNTAGFTYNPGINLKAGLYEFSVDLRTANPGETDYIRIKIGDTVYSGIITNEWLTFKVMLNIEKRTPFAVKFYGGPTVSSTKDYDIRNIHLLNTDDIPGGYNLVQDGSFDTEGKYGFFMGYGTGSVEWHEEDGNGYLSIVGRDLNHSPIRKNLGFDSLEGALYTISYDIRASHEGESFTVRAYMNNVELVVPNANPDSRSGNEYDITHEWIHIESTYFATGKAPMVFDIKGGQTAEDSKDFDIDNLCITKKGGATEDDMYPAGNFDDKGPALQGWYSSYGGAHAKFAWNEENGDGYVTVYERSMGHTPANIKLVNVTAGTAYKISYDIRATHDGDEFTVRSYANGTSLLVPGASNSGGNEFRINHEWRHIETTYYATADSVLDFSIKGGQGGDLDKLDFDINNLVIGLMQ